jgi:DNA-binding transcriptional MerR regulator
MATPPHPRNQGSILYGYPEEWKSFAERRSQFVVRFANLEKAIDAAFQRIHRTKGPLDTIIYFLGRLGVEEFSEILLLCRNGYGIGAQKLLRAMYERAVTARHLVKHPEDVRNYMDFHRVSDHKILQATKSLGGTVFSQQQAERIERDYEEVREQFLITKCKECKTTRLNHTWSKTDIVAMARESEDLWGLILHAYHLPTREFHSTMGAIFSRLDAEAAARNEGLIFDSAAQRGRADVAIFCAHAILLNILHLQAEHFQLKELEPLLQTCNEDFAVIAKAHPLGAKQMIVEERPMPEEEANRRRDLYDEHRKQAWQDIQSSTDDFDKNLLAVSSAAFGLSLGFIKDIVHLPAAVWLPVLYVSWGCLAACVVTTIFSFRLSVAALKKHLEYLYEYYVNEKAEYLTKKSTAERLLAWFTWVAASCFLAGIACTLIFCIKNLH